MKEFKNARSLSQELITKLSNSTIFGFDGDLSIPFSLKYMSAISLYLDQNVKNKNACLVELYKLQRDFYNFEGD
jgi:hypothetical protein